MMTRIVGAFVALTLILGFGASVPAVADTGLAADGPANLPMTETEFVESAIEVAGLTESEARAAYRDPEMVKLVPVEVVRNVEVVSSVSAAATRGCTMYAERIVNNIFGNDLYSYRIDKYFEYNEGVVLAQDVTVEGDVTLLGRLGGWNYTGTIDPADAWRSFGGKAHGAHFSARTGNFELFGEGGQDSDPIKVEVLVRGNGSAETTFTETNDQDVIEYDFTCEDV